MAAVRQFALDHPTTGYKRLAWLMVDKNVAHLRPWQVYGILQEHDLMPRRPQAALQRLQRPPEPEYPDRVWHIDLMYL
ncbi:MAG: hypothetical protein ACPL7R_02355, partial [Anaerolineae bacterium]